MARHYVLTTERIAVIQTSIINVLRRRFDLALAAFPLNTDEMLRLRWTDAQAELIRSTEHTEPGLLQRSEAACVMLPTASPTHGGMVQLQFSRAVIWRAGYDHFPWTPALSVKADRAPGHSRWVLGIRPPCELDASPDRVEANQRAYEWALDAYRAARRMELGWRLTTTLVEKAQSLTTIQATLPDVRAVLAKAQGLVHMMDLAPSRTIARYRSPHLTDQEVNALRTLLAEGLMLPETVETRTSDMTAVGYCYFDMGAP